MKNVKRTFWMAVIILLMGSAWNAMATKKILVFVDATAYATIQPYVTQYISDIGKYDHKRADVIVWPARTGSNFVQCIVVWDTLEQRYFTCMASGDALEGAVLVGDIPVPIVAGVPTDEIYMDIVDRSGVPQPYLPNQTPYFFDPGGNFTGKYGYADAGGPAGDGLNDIWVSRINGRYLNGGIRQGPFLYDEYSVYMNYFNRLHVRMTDPATVPSRGFTMGAPVDYDVRSTLTYGMRQLNLPWLAEFTGGDNSSFNWMSQLLAGPRGCITYGGFNGAPFPNWNNNSRYCVYDKIDSVYGPGALHPTSLTLNPSDSLGWEWAAPFGHSCPGYTDFFSDGDVGDVYNGRFSFGTLGPYWGTYPPRQYVVAGGYNDQHLWYQDNSASANPYSYPLGYKGKKAHWRWKVPANQPAGTLYNVYAYWEASPSNVNYIEYWLFQMSIFGGKSQHIMGSRLLAQPGSYIWPLNCDKDGLNSGCAGCSGPCKPPNQDQSTGQQQHYVHNLPDDPNWERIFPVVSGLMPDSMVEVMMPTYGSREYGPTVSNITGNYIIDAIRFISCNADTTPNYNVDQIVNFNDPAGGYPNQINNASQVYTTPGCYTSDGELRSFEDMGSEPGGGGISKPVFFMTNACGINCFTQTTPQSGDLPPYYSGPALIKNLGNLYALGYNGLICFGTATEDYSGSTKESFTTALRNGSDFGEAFLAQQSTASSINSNSINHALLGAGSLQAQPYIQYGSYVEQPRTISGTEGTSTYAPVLIQNVTVTGTGSWTVTSNTGTSSPLCDHSEIVVRPESDFAPTGTNVVDLKSN
jgi:hypothetical protein